MPVEIDWHNILDISSKQDVTAIAFDGVQSLPKDQLPPLEMLMYQLAELHRQLKQMGGQ